MLIVSMFLGFGEFEDYRQEVRNRSSFDIEVDAEKEAFKVVKLGGYGLAMAAWVGFLANI